MKGKDLIAPGQSEERATLSTSIATGKVDPEMKMSSLKYCLKDISWMKTCGFVRRARIYNETWLPKFLVKIYSVENRIW